MHMLGALLISSIIIFPCLSALFISKNFTQNTIIAVVISIFCFVLGLTLSYTLNTPTGATVVLSNLLALIICWIFSKLPS
jgi:zinc transport system permease protein